MTAPEQDPTPGPYATAAAVYWQAGFKGVLPLPAHAKKHPPKGWTGRDGAWPSYADITAWTEDRGAGNIALRLPPDVLGIDVDHYDSKPGGLVLARLEEQHGALPATWRTTSRDDGRSGIRLYRIPVGLRWPGILGPGIETIRHEHRYAVAWPSIHPEGGTYRWIRPDGTTSLHDVPTIDELPELPEAWIAHFTGGELATDQPKADLTDATAAAWLAQRGTGVPCGRVAEALDRHLSTPTTSGARHDAMLSATNRLIWLAGEGHTGATTALTEARAAFLTATAGDRAAGEAESEWDRAIVGAVRLAAAAHPQPSPDPCDDPFAGLIPKESACAPTAAAPTSSTIQLPTSPSSPAEDAEPSPTSSSQTQPDDDAQHRTTWWPRDLQPVLDGTQVEPPPEFLVRTDGEALLYAGKINGIIGPSESGKTWVALTAAVQAVHAGHNVTFLDFEDTDASVTNRFRLLGLTAQQIAAHVAYIGPDEALHAVAASDLHEHLDQWNPAIVVLDGFNAAMTLHAFDLMSNKDATSFFQLVLKHLKKNGAAVVYVDHTPKDKNNESSGGIGAQAKRAMTDGTILRASITKEFGKGQKGSVRLFVDKDRHGHVRGNASPFKVGERSLHWIADMTLTPGEGDRLGVELGDPQTVAEGRAAFRPTVYMERVSGWLQDHPGAGRNEIVAGVEGKAAHVKTALRILVEEGWVSVSQDGQKRPHTLEKPYSEAAELATGVPGSHRGPTGVPDPGSATGVPGVPPGDVVPGTRDPSATRDDRQPGSRPNIITRAIAGELVQIDMTTGEVIES